jgi:N-acetylglucosaminyldiphosphoundecaprenol N-acetyl-beta-D-mannosaminyltransferase
MLANRVEFLGCPVDNLSMREAVHKLEDFIHQGLPHHVAVINANKLWRMEKDSSIAKAVLTASLFIPEKAVVIGCRILRLNVKHHIGGIMLLKAFLPRAEEKGYKIYFLGANSEVLEKMIGVLRLRYARLRIVGWHDGYFTVQEEPAINREIKELCPDVVFVALGTPKQELWIAEHSVPLGIPVCMGVGGSFDVLAGLKKDAPDWIRTVALEWLYRLLQDPKNLWKRYLITMPWLLKKVLSVKMNNIISRIPQAKAEVMVKRRSR